MAKHDINIVDVGGMNTVPTYRWQTEAAATAINAGEPTSVKAAGSKYAIPLGDGTGVIGTTVAVLGIASSDDTVTSAADGVVDIYMPLASLVYRAAAKTSTTADTQSEIEALKGKRVVLDLTSSVYTVDAAAADNANNALVIIGGDPNTAKLDFILRSNITLFGNTL